jgi:hypothetical protein
MQPLHIIVFLILFPLLLSVASLVVRQLSVRHLAAAPANVLIAAGSILLLFLSGGEPIFFKVENALVEEFIMAGEVGMGVLRTYLGLSSKRYFIVLLGAVMTAMTVVFEFVFPPAHAVHHLFIDRFRSEKESSIDKIDALGRDCGWMQMHLT